MRAHCVATQCYEAGVHRRVRAPFHCFGTTTEIEVVWRGVAWRGVAWRGVAWRGVVWRGVVWCGVVWCGVVWCVRARVHARLSVCVYVCLQQM